MFSIMSWEILILSDIHTAEQWKENTSIDVVKERAFFERSFKYYLMIYKMVAYIFWSLEFFEEKRTCKKCTHYNMLNIYGINEVISEK